jgi:hypothetical protein
MNRRLALGVLLVIAAVSGAGCLDYATGGGEITAETLDQEPPVAYQWDADADVYIDVSSDATFTATYNVTGVEELRLYRTSFRGLEEPTSISAFRYQYPNGTVLSGSEFRARGGEIEQTPDEVFVRFGEQFQGGRIGIHANSIPKRLSLPVYVEGSHEIVLPPDRQVDFWLFGNVAPRGYETEIENGRQHISWDDVSSGTILVQFYLERDLSVFAVVMTVATAIGIGGAVYYKRRLDRLKRQRQEMGLDVEADEPDDDSPPGS